MNIYHRDTEAQRGTELLSEALTEGIIGAAIEVHRQLGPGLLESVYEICMCVERLLNVHEAQLLTYLKLTGKHEGLMINFNVSILQRGIMRRGL
jgi:hypothetical protein